MGLQTVVLRMVSVNFILTDLEYLTFGRHLPIFCSRYSHITGQAGFPNHS
jgi:hypothetical protein